MLCICQTGYSQTCCSGGVPVSSNIGFTNKQSNTLQLSLSANFNTLTSLYTESQRLQDDQRKRTTQSYLIRAHYSISERFAVETFVPFVRQTRSIFSQTSNDVDFESSFGIGDPILLASYKISDSAFKFTLGAGPQIPLGSFTQRNSRGLLLVEDLQPGSGAWDLIVIGIAEYSLPSRPTTNVFSRVIYSYTGNNDESRNGLQTYTFGNDIQVIAGVADQFLVANRFVSPSLALRYRFAEQDEIDFIPNNGTGGNWVFAKATLGFEFLWESSLSLDLEIPIHTFVNNTQLSPDSIVTISWSRSFKFSKNEVLINF